ncbi:MAG: VanZ family protein [Armatimonadota bacterium]
MERTEPRTAAPASRFRTPAFWLLRVLPPLLFMALIYWMGTERASAGETRSLLERLVALFSPAMAESLSPAAIELANKAVRKSGHFLSYALLAVLDARPFREPGKPLAPRWGWAAWLAATAWAAVDEFHQSFDPSRGGVVEDVFLDSAGAAFGVYLYQLWTRRASRRG